MARTRPFLADPSIEQFLPFDISNSTFCEFEKDTQLYTMIGDYIVKHGDQSYRFTPKKNVSKATRILEHLARIAKMHKDLKDLDEEQKEAHHKQSEQKMKDEEEKAKDKLTTDLGLGLVEFEYEGTKFYAVHQVIGDPVGGGYSCKAFVFQSLIVFVEGRGQAAVLKKFINGVIAANESAKDSLFFSIYRFDIERKYWRKSGSKIARDPDTIILPTKTWQRLLNDFERFLDEKSIRWYFEHGIPYKRSYLFYGVPGSGKSSLIQALSAKYDRNLCFLQPTHPKMTDEVFKQCIQTAPGNSLIVLEDIDALFNKDRSKTTADCPLTFSGLLNGLDGVGNPDGQIFIMTTNFVDRLDPALIRSGRVDLHIEFPLATDEQLQNIYLLFYPEEEECAAMFVTEVRKHFPDGISMAAVQQHFIQNMFAEPKLLVENVSTLGDRLDVVASFDKKEETDKEKEKGKQEQEQEEEQGQAAQAGEAAAAVANANDNQ